jgi:glycosyltransferase involved in cell wall biosynthesis
MTGARTSILHLTPLAAVGGCEVNCLRLIEELRHCEHRVLVFDEPGPMSRQWEAAGARVEHLTCWRSGRSAFRDALARWREAQPRPTGIICWSVSRLPAVLDALCGWGARWAVHLGNPAERGAWMAFRRWWDERRHYANDPVTLVACSRQVAESYRRTFYFRRYAPCEVIYNPVAASFDRPRQHRTLAPGDGLRIGMVARLDGIKDHVTLLRAFAAVVRTRADATLEFAGDGDRRELLQREAARLGVGERVRFLGFVPVAPLLATWDIYAHSTTAAEGMGTALAEAMLAGLPCVVSDLPVMREVSGPDGAIWVRSRDANAWACALLLLAADPKQRAVLGEAARRQARERFSAGRCAARYLELVTGRREPVLV